MPSPVHAELVVRGLIGRTLYTPTHQQPNTILEIDGANVIVGTQDSPGGENVALARIQQGLDLLFDAGELRIEPARFDGYRAVRRSARSSRRSARSRCRRT